MDTELDDDVSNPANWTDPKMGWNLLDRTLDPEIAQEVNCEVNMALMQLRSASQLHLECTDGCFSAISTMATTTATTITSTGSTPPNSTTGSIPHISKSINTTCSHTLPVLDTTLPPRLGELLGEGGFSSVYQVVGNPSLVCKVLSLETLSNPTRLKTAARDFIREGFLLKHLSHPNIIQLRGMGSLDFNNHHNVSHFFLLLDKLHKPLSSKIDEWGLATTANDQIPERLNYALPIVQAFVYLHSKNILYRDLKVDNLGLDAKDQVLLYDFGLAKEVKGTPDHDQEKYKLSGNTGSWPYMAPEVAKGYKYNKSVDVYSFGILLWELLYGEYAFDGRSNVDMEARPPFLRTLWPESLEVLLTDCWHWNPSMRPTFVQIEERLDAILLELWPHHKKNSGSASWFSWFV